MSGSAGGIGNLLTKTLSKKFKMICIYNKKKPKLLKSVRALKIDYNNTAALKKVCDKLKKIILLEKKIIFLNLAAIKIDRISLNIKKKEMNESFNVNYFSFFYITQSILSSLIKNKWGRIINFSSISSGNCNTKRLQFSVHVRYEIKFSNSFFSPYKYIIGFLQYVPKQIHSLNNFLKNNY